MPSTSPRRPQDIQQALQSLESVFATMTRNAKQVGATVQLVTTLRQLGFLMQETDPVFKASVAAKLQSNHLALLQALPSILESLQKDLAAADEKASKKLNDGRDGKDGKDGKSIIGPVGPKGDKGDPGVANMKEVKAAAEIFVTKHEKAFEHGLIHDSAELAGYAVDKATIGDDLYLKFDQQKKKWVCADIPRARSTGTLMNGRRTRVGVVTVTADYNVASSDDVVLVDASGGAITITLPPASISKGHEITIKKIDSSDNAVTISGTLDGEASRQLIVQNQFYRIACNGTSFYII